jgi:hypothetical protein
MTTDAWWTNTHAEKRELEPEDEDSLECVIPGDVVEDNAGGKAFQKVEETKHNPVCQPLDVILVRR